MEQIYSCWSGDESEPKEFERQIVWPDVVAPEFFFRERELFVVDYDVAYNKGLQA